MRAKYIKVKQNNEQSNKTKKKKQNKTKRKKKHLKKHLPVTETIQTCRNIKKHKTTDYY